MTDETTARSFLGVRNWRRFQHFKKPNPPWIKFYGIALLTDYEWTTLDVFDRGLLSCIWALTQSRGKWVPNDARWIAERIGRISERDGDTADDRRSNSKRVYHAIERLVRAQFLYLSPTSVISRSGPVHRGRPSRGAEMERRAARRRIEDGLQQATDRLFGAAREDDE